MSFGFVGCKCGNPPAWHVPNNTPPTRNLPTPAKSLTPITKPLINNIIRINKKSNQNTFSFLLKTLHALQENDPVATQNINQLNPHKPNFPTALHEAAALGDVTIVQALLDSGAKTNIRAKNQEIPLHKALNMYNFKAAKLLLQQASPSDLSIASTDTGWKPLAIAIYTGNLEMVKLILAKSQNSIDAEIDVHEKMTALHIAAMAMRSNLSIVQYLVEEKHAQLNLKDCHQKTPLDWAIAYKNQEIIDYLHEKGATLG